jgi:hypothetical protein
MSLQAQAPDIATQLQAADAEYERVEGKIRQIDEVLMACAKRP